MVNWNDAADRALLLNVIDPVAKPNWDRVAASMGNGFTAEACRQHFRKLKNEVFGDNSPATTSPSPSKAKRKTNGAHEANITSTKKPRGRKPTSKEPKAELTNSNTDTDDKNEISANNKADNA
ncbi:hypothetical protein AJ78_04097 [Emergomyces pasteurianus Ep9510]|uniref:Myb-like domain-containing protein n=1 Tax=Emergomyces pasteurianus Ep9510 TaxID=1447872 RepID=A0A1J9QHQ8_9EURO|nr:hypothetical protein AJ78_04097 [Emergomyces pasteurianus Ep9510]